MLVVSSDPSVASIFVLPRHVELSYTVAVVREGKTPPRHVMTANSLPMPVEVQSASVSGNYFGLEAKSILILRLPSNLCHNRFRCLKQRLALLFGKSVRPFGHARTMMPARERDVKG